MGTNTVHATEEDADDESLKAGLVARIKRRGCLPPPFQASTHSPTCMRSATPPFARARSSNSSASCSVGGSATLVDGAASVMAVNSVTVRRILTRLQPDFPELEFCNTISWHVLGERSAFRG